MHNHFRSGLRGEDIRTIRKQMGRTRAAMWAETLVRAFWPAATVLCFVLAAALLGFFAAFGPEAHRVLLAVAGLALAASLVVGGMRLRCPTPDEVAERLDTSDPRRPLNTLRDHLAVGRGEEQSEAVWQAHRDRARSALGSLVARWPDLRLSSRDTWALRLLAPVLLVGGLIATNGEIGSRIAAMADPAAVETGSQELSFTRAPAAEAWATPPAYTGLDTIYLNDRVGEEGPIVIPQGSEITIRVTDTLDVPEIAGGALAGMETFATLGGGLAEARGVLTGSGELAVMLGGDELARYPIEMTPDAPPSIAMLGHPAVTVTRSLDIAFEASDDYGVAAAWAEIAPEGHDPENAKGLPLPVITFGLPLPISGDMRTVADSAIRDFTAHPWAGGEVVLQLFAEDGAEQLGETGRLTITLPGRYFSNPLARALVEQRRELAFDYGEADRVLDVLQAVMRRPHELFEQPNTGAYLVIRTAIRRLATGIGTETMPDAAPEVIELLWLAALGLEDGDLSSALERLRQAQEQLRQALENGTDEDIRRAMEELRAAMNEYLQQLAQQAPQGDPNQQQGQMDPNQMLSQQDLQEMLDRLQQQAEGGMRDEARQMLSELSRMLENLQAAQRQPGQQSPGQQALQDLQEMIQRQRDLSDRTFDELRESQREQQLGQQGRQMPGQRGQEQPGWGEGQGSGNEHGQQGQSEGEGMGDPNMEGGMPGSGGLAQEQEALRRELENLARGLGSEEAARALEEAVRSMGEARDDLQGGNNSEAVRDQMQALDQLNEGAEALAQDVQQGQGETRAQGEQQGEGMDATRNDPFDRPSSSYGALDGRATRVPDKALIDRARELMDELRRRAAEPDRPQMELDYLDRLMERF